MKRTPMINRPGPGPGNRGPGSPSGKRAGVAVRTIEVPYATSNSGVDMTAPVTVRVAPWDKEDGKEI